MIQKPGPRPDGAPARSTLRLFTGIAAPPEINSRLDELVRQLKPLAPIRWTPISNFHITTKFIGSWPQDRLDEMKTALSTVAGGDPIRISVQGLGFYPNARHPRIFRTDVEGGAPLMQLASDTDQACAKLGLAPEDKPYSPHLTLARIDSHASLGALHNALAKLNEPEFGVFQVPAFHLYLSQPGRGGSVYTSLQEFPL